MDYEQILAKAVSDGLEIHENYDLSGTDLKGLYCDGSVALSNELQTSIQKKCVLLEEIGHHKTSYGDILDVHDEKSIKQEHRARAWAYNDAIAFSDIVEAYKNGCRNRFELADQLDLTEEFLEDALSYFHSKYGQCTKHLNYLIFFEPLGVLELYN